MEVNLSDEQETRLAELAARAGTSTDELVQDAVSRYLDDDTRFVEAVLKGIESLDRGDYVSHDEVGATLRRRFGT
jgi:predicted transcriptional regulator